jgi:DivIVA domain-containing protein
MREHLWMSTDRHDDDARPGSPPEQDAPTAEWSRPAAEEQPTELDLRAVDPAEEPPAPAPDEAPTSIVPLDVEPDIELAEPTPEPPPPLEADEIMALRGVTFPLALRGYNTHAVDRYVELVERAIERFEEHREPTVAVQRALDRVGEQTAAILREAERSAEETTHASRARADDRVQRAEAESAELWAAAQARARSLDEDIERLWQERQRLIDATRALAGQLREAADAAEAQFPPEPVAGTAGGTLPAPATAAGGAPGDAEPSTDADPEAAPPHPDDDVPPTPV